MPILSMFYGIIVRMQNEKGGKHNLPHIHVEYQGKRSVFNLDGKMLEGDIPNKQRKLVEAWILLHEEELQANWTILAEGKEFFKIDPLH